MEKKGTIISLIFIFVIIGSAVALIIISGITAREYNYVQLEINPRVEFLCDKDYKVVSYRAINDEARTMLAGVEYKGLDIDEVCIDFIDTCAKAGYIDVDGVDNAINVTVIDGITQALDVHVVENIYKYLRANEILCAVLENYEDRSMIDAKKEMGTCCPNKFKLMQTLHEYDNSLDLKDLNKLSEVSLIDMVANIHSTTSNEITEDDITLKAKLIDFGREKYDTHINVITNNSQKEFSEVFDDYQRLSTEKYRINFQKEYTDWQNSHIS